MTAKIILLLILAIYGFIRSYQCYCKAGDTKYSRRVSFAVSLAFIAVSSYILSRAIRELLQ